MFCGIDLANSRWGGAMISGCRFLDCRLTGAAFTKIRGIGYEFTRCLLKMATLPGLDFSGQRLVRLNFSGADLGGANFTNAIFEECSLHGVNLRGAKFTGADLRGAGLGDISLNDTPNLKGAIISVAQANTLLAELGLQVLPE